MTKEEFLIEFVMKYHIFTYATVQETVKAGVEAWNAIQGEIDQAQIHPIFKKRITDVVKTAHAKTLSDVFNNVDELVRSSRENILGIPNIGPCTIRKVDEFIDKNGLWYGMDNEDIVHYSKTHRA